MRFSLKTLMMVISFTAIACVALTQPTRYSLSIVTTIVLACLATSVVVAIFTPLERKPFWVGFAVFGWSFLMSQTSLSHPGRLFWLGPDEAILSLGRFLHGDKMCHGELWRIKYLHTDNDVIFALSFETAAYYLSSILVAVFGGLLAKYINRIVVKTATTSGPKPRPRCEELRSL